MIPALYAIFLLSGSAGLIFETLWFRQAGLAFGNSVWASSVVLSSFMLGLAIGNGLSARFAARLRRPVRVYAYLELAIAVSGIALVWGLPGLGPRLAPLLGALFDAPWLHDALRMLCAFALLLIPATAMGATLPVLVRALIGHDPNFGAVLGRLYGWNTLGAVLGVVATETWLLGAFGVRGSGAIAGACDVLAAGAALALAGRMGATSGPDAAERRAAASSRAFRLAGAALGSGALLLALEVVWFRFLQLFVAGTALAFSLMLASVLLGIAAGGLAAGAWLARWPRSHRHAPVLALAAGIVTVLVYRGFAFFVAPHTQAIVHRPGDILVLALTLTFPVSCLSGALFTFLGAQMNEELAPASRAAGWVTLANTVGAGVGSLLAGFVLLPEIGMERSLWLLAALYGGVAVLALSSAASARRPAVLVATAVFGATIALFPSGLMRDHYLERAIQRVGREGQWQVAAIREGLSETIVFLRKLLHGTTHYHKLMTNGFSMSGTSWGSQRYMKLYTWWPVALAPEPRSALLISFGVGSTAKSLTETESLERIDVVDISREILSLTPVVYRPADDPLRDPRVRVHVEDGRYFLQTTDERYDLITGEPPPPKYSGVVNLYTREYFSLIRQRLREGGINTYWLPVHSLTEADTKAIIRAYCDVFEDCSLWSGWQFNWMLTGSRGARWSRSETHLARQWQNPRVAREMRRLGVEVPAQLGALFLADAEQLADYVGDTAPLVDDHPKRLESRMPSNRATLATYDAWLDASLAEKRFRESRFIREIWPESLRDRSLGFFRFQQALNDRGTRPNRRRRADQRFADLHALLVDTPLRVPVLWNLGTTPDRLRIALRSARRGMLEPGIASRFRSTDALARRDFEKAASLLEAAQRDGTPNPLLLYTRVYALCAAGRVAEAAGVAREAATWLPRQPGDLAYWTWMASTFGLPDPLAGPQP